ncbi:MAG: hypothetical protein QOI62_4015 [Solirubrobacteraceae bacterium]|jgi:hypothetical protein|nr:hypothetical protein [Solirubrobacteraceae bacterium]
MGPGHLAIAAAAALALTPAAGGARVAQPAAQRPGFTHPTRIDNRWLPLAPGTRYTLVGHANRGDERLRHREVLVVTDLTKVIDGVRTVVIWDRDFAAGRLREGELAFNAQDDRGNVWNFGEYPEVFERGRLTGAPDTWIVGLAGARAGIAMRAHPRAGTPAYRQGLAPAIDFADEARVYRLGQPLCIPLRCFAGVLETDEWTPAEPGAHQRKFYARGVGTIRVGAVGDREDEILVLDRVEQLGARDRAAVRRAALRIDDRAYRVSRDLYGKTPRAEATPRAGEE